MKKIIHVNQHVIKSNRKNNTRKPPLTCKTYKTNDYAHEIYIDGPCRIVYNPDKPLSCGAHVWIETKSHTYIERREGPSYEPHRKRYFEGEHIRGSSN